MNKYTFGDNEASRQMFNRRSLNDDAAHLKQYLKPGLKIIDCGCGAGSITMDIAAATPDATVIGFDISQTAVDQARQIYKERKLKNIQFLLADIAELDFLDCEFDIVTFTGVLSHLSDPEQALGEVNRILRPGGIIGAREIYKSGDWFSGPGNKSIREFNDLLVRDWITRGADPNFGIRLPGMLQKLSYLKIDSRPSYSTVLSQPAGLGRSICEILSSESDLAKRLTSTGLVSAKKIRDLIEGIDRWSRSKDSLAAISEVVVHGFKPVF